MHFYKLLALDMPVVLIAEDEQTFNMYETRLDIAARPGKFQIQSHAEYTNSTYGSKTYRKLVSNRAGYILETLKLHKNVIYTDVDTVWLGDPRPYFLGDYDMWMPLGAWRV